MKIIDDIRIKAGQKKLSKLLKDEKRDAKSVSLSDANKVALLLKIETQEDYSNARKFGQFLKQEFGLKKLFVLGYVDVKKDLPEYLQSKVDFDFFTKDDLDWRGIPSGGVVDNFIAEDYDILIDLNNYYNVPLRFVILSSSASMKVGRFSEENTAFFDVMVGEESDDFETFCNTMVKYLVMIKPKS